MSECDNCSVKNSCVSGRVKGCDVRVERMERLKDERWD